MIALSTGSLYTYGTARVFRLAAQAGYDGVEVLMDHRWDTRQSAYMRRLVGDSGLSIVAVHSPFVVDVPGWPVDQLGRLRHAVAVAQELGVTTVVTHLPFRLYAVLCHWLGHRRRRLFLPVPLRRRELYADFLCSGLAAFEAAEGVTIAVENMPSRRFLGARYNWYRFNSPAELERFPHLTLDTTHLGTWGLDTMTIYKRLRDRVVHVHLSNYDGREHRSPPDGQLALAQLLRYLTSDGYQGAITVECHPGGLHDDDEVKCKGSLRRALEFCRSSLEG